MQRETPIDQVDNWCRDLPAATRGHPFGHQVAVFKVGGKMFAMASEDGPPDTVTVKGPPEENEALRMQHTFVRAGYYMNKRHWITVDLGPDVPMELVHELIQESYRLVVAALPKRKRVELGIAGQEQV